MKLEVGKKYVSRDGEIVEIIRFDPYNSWAYSGIFHGVLHRWFEDGQWWVGPAEHKFDLVSEYTEQTTPPPPPKTPENAG